MGSLLTVEVLLAPEARRHALAQDAATGLRADPKRLSPIWFYDERGSKLFDEITRLPEYYLTRAERSILAEHASEIVERSGCDTLVELGSGTSEKTRLLLDAMSAADALRRIVPFDVSEETLRTASEDLSAEYHTEVWAVVGDFHRHLGAIPREGRRLVAFLGSTIGNLTPAERSRFFFDLDATMTIHDRFLLGTDLVKDPRRLVAAYDDAAGVTAAFNRNMLSALNQELGAEFDPETFDHVARWNAQARWVEMRLRSTIDQHVPVADLDMIASFTAGEDLHTEISAKFTPDQIERELWERGFIVEDTWTDADGNFQLTLARTYC